MEDGVLFLLIDGIWLLFRVITMIMIPTLIVGLVVGIFSAATQIQEATLSFIPKVMVIAFIMVSFGHEIQGLWVEYATRAFTYFMVVQ
jgi:flagellar biosynthetic protein FliQ